MRYFKERLKESDMRYEQVVNSVLFKSGHMNELKHVVKKE
jgi:hypothetical protein